MLALHPVPIVAAPMAGGPSTVELVRAVAVAGGAGFFPAGYLSAAQFAARLDELRALDIDAWGVNLFAPVPGPAERSRVSRYAHQLRADAEALGVSLGEPRFDDDAWDDKLALLRESPAPVVSAVFGLPSVAEVRGLRRAGSIVLATVTSAAEARAAAERGVDGLIVQGPDAGGHSAALDPAAVDLAALDPASVDVAPSRPHRTVPHRTVPHRTVPHRTVPHRTGQHRTAALVARVRASVSLPIIGTGGISHPAEVAEVLASGAHSVAVGTALLLTPEAGTNAVHRAALSAATPRGTVMTRAFTGRPARALRSRFTDAHPDAPDAYPELHHLTRPLRQAAIAAGDAQRVHLWAGTGYRSARAEPAASVIARLAEGV